MSTDLISFFGPRAALWRGTAESWVDLHSFLPAPYSWSRADDIEVVGSDIWVVGVAGTGILPEDLEVRHAVMWHYVVPEPATMSSCMLVTVGLLRPRRQRVAPILVYCAGP